MTIRVLLADDQAMIRASLRIILEDQPDITVVAEAGDGVEAIEQARRTNPDVCLVDVQMPRLDGIEVARALAGAPTRVVMVTTFDLDEYVYGALRRGAAGFVLKDAGPRLLVEAVRAAYAGDALISPSITLRLLRHLADREARAAARAPASPLSARETEIVEAVARGCTNREIADEFFLSLSTVKGHVSGIMDKLGVRNRVEIVAWAWENHLIDTD
ncbi:response regulator [Nonomuraea jiangxiensis]|uniref:DNA-binding response regulator, NarL/FixJ family, contains REC and HTH domains n=1 Tax=Nonomuraea jiangxiensis TaxID=633440 RepID=A0A1G9BAG9_9ACTN|nr:response regulator transcription factor [Nonomuraea jiangxiensis]SDK36060.1 DNA-binding response regulator, NarL/FixJ family, contains REC and HTH domains [Nonomuraea jiangxiensis]